MSKEEETRKQHNGLCHRCEHRARNKEDDRYQPRCECGDEGAVYGCYMYQPVKPMKLQKLYDDDDRPLFGPWMIAARMKAAGRADDMQMDLHVDDEGRMALFWKPPDEEQEGAHDGKKKKK